MGTAPTRTDSGHLHEVSAARLIGRLADDDATGMLRIGHANPVWIAFDRGRVVTAGAIGGPSIRSAVISSGVISAEQVAQATAHATGNDLVALAALVERFGADTLRPIVRENVVSTVFQLLLPSSEAFVFAETPAPPFADSINFSTSEILDEATGRVAQWAVIAESISSVEVVLRPRRKLPADSGQVTLTPREWEVLSVLDGRRSVAQVISAVGRNAFDVCTVLHRFLVDALVERVS